MWTKGQSKDQLGEDLIDKSIRTHYKSITQVICPLRVMYSLVLLIKSHSESQEMVPQMPSIQTLRLPTTKINI